LKTLGVNVYGHDTAAALVIDGELICAVEEERLSRQKHDAQLPFQAIEFCLRESQLTVDELDLIAFSTDLDRLVREKYLRYHLENYDLCRDHLAQSAGKISEILGRQEKVRTVLGFNGQIESFQHHQCHLASSYYQSGFSECAVVSIDGQGEIETTMTGRASEGRIQVLSSLEFPHSLGLFYTALTYYLGYKPQSAEGTVMALAALGHAEAEVPGLGRTYRDIFSEIITLEDNGTFRIGLDWFNYPHTRTGWVSASFTSLFGPPRTPESELDQHFLNIAAAMQQRFEEAYIHVLQDAHERTGSANLALAGGCALNCVANGKIISRTGFENVYIQPAAGDAGCAIGAAQLASISLGDTVTPRQRLDTYLGPQFDNTEIEHALELAKQPYEELADPSRKAAELLARNDIIAWFQGRAEFGPRALGNRSILAAPFPIDVKDRINAKVKHREFFRPFAPAVLDDRFEEVFDGYRLSPFMLMAMTVKDAWKEKVPAIIHLDDSARVQTVLRDTNPQFFALIHHFNELTGVPVVLNTSFNDKGEPMVCSPADALNTFNNTEIDHLIMGNYLISKPKRI
jgi:carbamoyltransferase